jgi:hypothetical protein
MSAQTKTGLGRGVYRDPHGTGKRKGRGAMGCTRRSRGVLRDPYVADVGGFKCREARGAGGWLLRGGVSLCYALADSLGSNSTNWVALDGGAIRAMTSVIWRLMLRCHARSRDDEADPVRLTPAPRGLPWGVTFGEGPRRFELFPLLPRSVGGVPSG